MSEQRGWFPLPDIQTRIVVIPDGERDPWGPDDTQTSPRTYVWPPPKEANGE